VAPQNRRAVSDGSVRDAFQNDQVRALVPVFALAVAIVAAITDPSSMSEVALAAIPVAAFAVWAYVPGVSLVATSVVVLIPVVVAQRSGQLEPLLFDASLLAFVVARYASSLAAAVALGLLVVVAPVVAALIQDPAEIAVGIWIMGVAFPWVIGRAAAHQRELALQLAVTRQELTE
jgi:hypothetical protein